MAEINTLLSENLALALGLLALLVVLLAVAVIIQSARLSRAVRAYRTLVGDGSGGTLADVLTEHIQRVERASIRLNELQALHELLEQRTRDGLQHVGLVRFNPFEDTGSDQSFAIALLDGRRDGLVISSLHGRANTRVFAKPVEGGASSHNLSGEEAEAIRIATEGTGDAAAR
jgi:Protein of unknown function (DUF4446)